MPIPHHLQTMEKLSKQLEELTWEDGSKIYKHVSLGYFIGSDVDFPCASITVQFNSLQIDSLFPLEEPAQIEPKMLEFRDIIFTHFGKSVRFNYLRTNGKFYRQAIFWY